MRYLLEIPIEAILEPHKSLVLGFVLIFKIDCNFIFLVLQFLYQVAESLIEISNLLTEQLMELFPRLL